MKLFFLFCLLIVPAILQADADSDQRSVLSRNLMTRIAPYDEQIGRLINPQDPLTFFVQQVVRSLNSPNALRPLIKTGHTDVILYYLNSYQGRIKTTATLRIGSPVVKNDISYITAKLGSNLLLLAIEPIDDKPLLIAIEVL